MEDGRCKLGLQGRLELVLLVEQGSTLMAAARESASSVVTASEIMWQLTPEVRMDRRTWARFLALRAVPVVSISQNATTLAAPSFDVSVISLQPLPPTPTAAIPPRSNSSRSRRRR